MARQWHQPAEAPAQLVCTKEPFREPDVPRKIKQICFGLQTPQDIMKCGVFHVYERSLYKMPERAPHPNGVLDKRLGISNKMSICETCHLKLTECAGHFGYIRLELPVFHIGYFKNTLQVLQCICKTCSRLLLSDADKRKWSRRFRRPGLERVPREGLISSAMLINSELPGVNTRDQGGAPARPLRGFVQRLKGKQGRFRGNLSGKRVDFSARTVISPDPNLAINQVAVPLHMATTLTYPERVTAHNLRRLKEAVMAGHSAWPGANFVEKADGGRMYLANDPVRRKQAAELVVGDVVERHLRNGDIVLFNRQPSLHRVSIMAFRAVVRPGRTLRFNECVCSPFNADFDGDEMNLHLPQTEEARAEALTLMASTRNLCTPKNGETLIAATQDFLTAAFYLTGKDRFFNRAQARARGAGRRWAPGGGGGRAFDRVAQLAAYMVDALYEFDLPRPAVIKPQELWTGKQLFSLLLRPNKSSTVWVTLELPEREYSKAGLHMCPKDGYVSFRNSELICGRLGKVILGGNKGGLFYTLAADCGPDTAAEVMSRLAKLSARALGEAGFSIGIDDVTPAASLTRRKGEIMAEGDARCGELIERSRKGKLELLPGCSLEQSLEASLTGVLNGLRESAGAACMQTLAPTNSPLIMSQCGSKGSPINIAQMVACVGQQSVGGRRCFDGFAGRTLPHFNRGDRSSAAKGFVRASFFEGLSPGEFFFHTMAGREGLVDTAVKTAETGYMSRRLMKALEDLYAHYDGTTRNAAGAVVQFLYGDDGMDPVLMEGGDGSPLDLGRTLHKVRAATGLPAATAVPLPPALAAAVEAALGSDPALRLSEAEEVEGDYAGPDGEPLGPDALRARRAQGKDVRPEMKPQDAFRGPPLEAPPGAAADGAYSERFKRGVRKFLRDTLGLPQDARGAPAAEYAAGLSGLTQEQLRAFLERCRDKYRGKRIDPGSTVGAVGAQSIGEPGTQMTLKTFHFAGVASMNVTLGVPRIKEIINGSKNISTPIIRVRLVNDRDEAAARLVQGRLERTTLGQVARRIAILLNGPTNGPHAVPSSAGAACVEIVLDPAVLGRLHLAVDCYAVALAISRAPRLKARPALGACVRVKWENIVRGHGRIYVRPALEFSCNGAALLFELERLLRALPEVIVAGIPTVARAIVAREKDRNQVLIEGTNLQAAMGVPGVLAYETTTNHIAEIEKFLGIEAARVSIMNEIKYTMGSHGMSIDERHTMLLADCMTYKGEVLGITRFGIAKMKDSVLHTASFEKTADHLFDAAIHGRTDDVVGVSESIIMGIPMPTGTGLFKLLQDVAGLDQVPPPRAPPLFAY
ncbi:DNA-directed RNA polymerase III subunit [Raphidocelis subcapitata]|uniref:DNA-directed RNA polymerase subunit n=1 Tax=Raphidocelis subcapitata TaxID=307507 RepID=A0A2V0P676_9CHLO|nr:DNA-directed RNA polymerase III subunit [Raphidocelis subcapitata]|eukprot:GBF92585.1 DNA-directed RNA polymerase III subunit [Raphidocelis subcapitata]